MMDREKVIEGQKQVILHLHRMSEVSYDGDVPYYEELRDKAEDALELLKDSELVVRCKDCKHGEPGACGYGVDCDGVWHDDDGFCSDGERKEGR